MKSISLIRLGEDEPGFLLGGPEAITTFDSPQEAYAHIDYSRWGASEAIHWMTFKPEVYTFSGETDQEIFSIIEKGLMWPDGTFKRARLRNVSGRMDVALFPEGVDPFPDAVRVKISLRPFEEAVKAA